MAIVQGTGCPRHHIYNPLAAACSCLLRLQGTTQLPAKQQQSTSQAPHQAGVMDTAQTSLMMTTLHRTTGQSCSSCSCSRLFERMLSVMRLLQRVHQQHGQQQHHIRAPCWHLQDTQQAHGCAAVHREFNTPHITFSFLCGNASQQTRVISGTRPCGLPSHALDV